MNSIHDLPDAWLKNPQTSMKLTKNTHNRIEIQKKINKRVSTRESPCVQYEYNTCRNIEENKLALDKFNCQIPILYFGHHLDHLIPRKTHNCSQNVTKMAISLFKNRKSDCTRLQACENKRYTATYKSWNRKDNKTMVIVAFENPEVEYHNTYISYGLLSLVGEVGGTLGLTLGASIMTLLDIILQHLPYY